MADNNNTEYSNIAQLNVDKLFKRFVILNYNLLRAGVSIKDLQEVCKTQDEVVKRKKLRFVLHHQSLALATTLVVTVFISILLKTQLIDSVVRNVFGTRCIVPNNYFIWEATRPETDCDMCRNVTEVLVLHNVSRKDFEKYAYSPQPMLIKGAALHWSAMKTFSYHFFKNLYESIEGAYESVEDECQILTFKTEFKTLKDVFSMTESQVQLLDGETPWYVGWSNCHPDILSNMRQHYSTPHFLPEDAEHARMDYIFIGYHQGAVMHIDYISRLMWQAQIQGHKTWKLKPPPDCDEECSGLSFTVDPGDIDQLRLINEMETAVVNVCTSEVKDTMSSFFKCDIVFFTFEYCWIPDSGTTTPTSKQGS